jgi:hypothetical protein
MSRAYSLSRKEGWRRFVDAPPRSRPEVLDAAALTRLGQKARAEYDRARHEWHANFGTIATPQLTAVRDALELIVASNLQDADRVRGAAVLDGLPGLGKTTIANLFAREYDRAERSARGALTEAGDERIPVFRVGLTSHTTLRTVNAMICEFYGHPAAARASAAQLAGCALDCVLACESAVGIIDDVHFIDQRRRDGAAVNNHLKWLANELPVTFIYAGVGLAERGFFDEGLLGPSAALAQTARRWTRLEVGPFTRRQRAGWLALAKAVEQRLVLARARPGQLVEQADYLFARTGGHIGSFITLIARGCYYAIATGREALTRQVLDAVRIDEAAEKALAGTVTGRARATA